MDLITEQLDVDFHDRASFDCGVEELNIFLRQHANQNQSKNVSKTFVAVVAVLPDSNHQKKIYGYYTLSAGQIYMDNLPEKIKSKLPRYPVPIARIGRLAIDENYKNRGFGSFLLYDVLIKILEIAKKIGIFAVVVDAKNENSKSFYKQYGFCELQGSELTLFLTVKTIESIVKQKNMKQIEIIKIRETTSEVETD